MKFNTNKKLRTLMVLAAIGAAGLTKAQLVLPQPSPKASVMQTVGLTDITIEYSSPAVKGRKIWGELVPFDKVWRAGANAATKITFSRDVVIEGTSVPKGSYSIFVIPASTGDFTFIINKDATASAESYKMEQDVVRILSRPIQTVATAPVFHERLCYSITDFTNEEATINLAWEKVLVSFKVKVDTDKQAVENIDKAVNGTWSIYNNSARYYFGKNDNDKALGYVNQSIALSDQWFNNWIKAQILFAKGSKEEAYTFAAHSKELGDKNPDAFFYKDDVEKALADWAAFAPKGKKKGK